MINGDKIRQLRQKSGVSQYQMAKDSDVFQPTINRIESGKIKNPKMETVMKIAKYFGIKIDEIYL